jgi:hypothetical protein
MPPPLDIDYYEGHREFGEGRTSHRLNNTQVCNWRNKGGGAVPEAYATIFPVNLCIIGELQCGRRTETGSTVCIRTATTPVRLEMNR